MNRELYEATDLARAARKHVGRAVLHAQRATEERAKDVYDRRTLPRLVRQLRLALITLDACVGLAPPKPAASPLEDGRFVQLNADLVEKAMADGMTLDEAMAGVVDDRPDSLSLVRAEVERRKAAPSLPAQFEADIRFVLAAKREGKTTDEAVAACFDRIDNEYRVLLRRAVEHLDKT